MKSGLVRRVLLAVCAAAISVTAIYAAPQAASGGSATMTVTVVGKKNEAPPPVTKDDVQLSIGRDRKQIANWAKADKLYLAILIDDALDQSVASQWNDVRDFLNTLPPTTYVAIGYASNNVVQVAQDFTNDHALAGKALRIPLGGFGSFGSPYLATIDWMKRWTPTGDRRSLILISSGIDYFRRGFGPFYPDVDPAISLANRGNINLWSLYSVGAGHRSQSFFLANNGQNNLSKLTQGAGGEFYGLGTQAPVSFKPYLDEIRGHLDNQYLMTFLGDGGTKGKFVGVHLKTELQNTEFMNADQAWITPSAK